MVLLSADLVRDVGSLEEEEEVLLLALLAAVLADERELAGSSSEGGEVEDVLGAGPGAGGPVGGEGSLKLAARSTRSGFCSIILA